MAKTLGEFNKLKVKKVNSFFRPKSVAIIGASSNRKKVGFAILNNIMSEGFGGEIYVVNPNERSILGLRSYANVGLIKDKIDLAIISIPASLVPEVLEECGQKSIKNVIIISSGFRETGEEGAKLENSLFDIARKYRIKILGPNALGFINNTINLNASFTDIIPPKGPIAFISQSGAICSVGLDLAQKYNIGYSYFVSLGNELNFKEIDVIEKISLDPNVKVIAGYLEGISSGNRFRKIISKIVQNKPIILLKAGVTKRGAKAASSHTGSLAGSYNGVKTLFKQTGVITVRNSEDLINLSSCLAYQKFSSRFNIAIVTNAGGPGVLTTDYCLQDNLKLAEISDKTKAILKRNLPSAANLDNPIDIIGDAPSSRYEVAINALLQDKNVDVLIVLLTPQAMTECERTAEVIVKAHKRYKKPILTSFMGGKRVERAILLLQKNHIPSFNFPEKAVFALKKISDYKNQKIGTERLYKFPLSKEKINKIENILAGQKGFLGVDKIYDIFKIYRMPLLQSKIVLNENEGIKAALKIGFPVALKIFSDEIIHRTDVGGVVLNINSLNELKESFRKIKANLKRKKLLNKIKGYEVAEMINEGQEVILGVKKDKLGHLLMFGWGGIYTEILNDVSFRLAPVSRKDVKEMITETKVSRILEGARTGQKYNINLIIDCILKISDLVTRFPQISELDINPLRLFGTGGRIIDIKMKIDGK